jgi:hypothetical protein
MRSVPPVFVMLGNDPIAVSMSENAAAGLRPSALPSVNAIHHEQAEVRLSARAFFHNSGSAPGPTDIHVRTGPPAPDTPRIRHETQAASEQLGFPVLLSPGCAPSQLTVKGPDWTRRRSAKRSTA